jgi:hypothetical protein
LEGFLPFQSNIEIKRQASLPSSYRYPILTYFKIGFWDGLSPNSRRGAFFMPEGAFGMVVGNTEIF